MLKSTKYLLVGSTEAYSGKSATILGIASQLQARNICVGYGKLIGTYFGDAHTDGLEEDIRLISETLNLPSDRLYPPLLSLNESTISKQVAGEDDNHYQQQLAHYLTDNQSDITILEGPGTLDEGKLFGLSMPEVAEAIDTSVLLVARYHSALIVDPILSAKERMGDRLMGVMINDVPDKEMKSVTETVIPFLESQGIPIFGVLPQSEVLRSVSVNELVKQLNAEILCCGDRLDLMVESLKIGAMNVNSALKYFRKARNMAVVTGGDRTDLQLAALETSTHCLILTGHIAPTATVLSRAEELEIPILSVDLDTLTTVEIIDHTFGQVRLQEPIKVECIRDLMAKYFDVDQLIHKLGLELVSGLS
ncbi:MAG: phosphotransacetylase family protein [Elainellaceae cyanobacterium]